MATRGARDVLRVAYLALDHDGSLRAEYVDGLEHVDDALVAHALEHDAQRGEDAGAADAGAAVHRDGTILTELLLRLVHLADEVDETLA